MKSSKLYSILEYFDKYEQNRLRKFIISPYFNKNEAIIGLYGLLIDHLNKDKDSDISKEELWKKIYPKVDYDDVLFRKNCSDLLKLIESYLAFNLEFASSNLILVCSGRLIKEIWSGIVAFSYVAIAHFASDDIS